MRAGRYKPGTVRIVLDLKTERGRQLLYDLAQHFDVFVENYGPGVLESLNIDVEHLRELNPRLICARVKGFGLTGPYKDFMVYDWVAQAAAGTFSVTGSPDGPPMHPGPTFADSGAGLQMALAITAAYVQRQRTGEPCANLLGAWRGACRYSMRAPVALMILPHLASSDFNRVPSSCGVEPTASTPRPVNFS